MKAPRAVSSRAAGRGAAASVGVRDLKASLSRYLRRVRAGESIVVTDRGEPVARLVPASLPEGLAQMIREGRLSWGGRKPEIPRDAPKVRGRKTLADTIIEDRG